MTVRSPALLMRDNPHGKNGLAGVAIPRTTGDDHKEEQAREPGRKPPTEAE